MANSNPRVQAGIDFIVARTALPHDIVETAMRANLAYQVFARAAEWDDICPGEDPPFDVATLRKTYPSLLPTEQDEQGRPVLDDYARAAFMLRVSGLSLEILAEFLIAEVAFTALSPSVELEHRLLVQGWLEQWAPVAN